MSRNDKKENNPIHTITTSVMPATRSKDSGEFGELFLLGAVFFRLSISLNIATNTTIIPTGSIIQKNNKACPKPDQPSLGRISSKYATNTAPRVHKTALRFWDFISEKYTIRKRPSYSDGLFIIWHRAIFPGLDDPSIVTATRLNCCVRNGNRCFPRAMGTNWAFLLDTRNAGLVSIRWACK